MSSIREGVTAATAEQQAALRAQPLGTADERTPQHYQGDRKLQPWDVIDAFHLDFWTGNVVKYTCRYGMVADLKDLEKAAHYLDAAIKRHKRAMGQAG